MKTSTITVCIGIAVCSACGNAERATGDYSISGTYVREYSRKILNQNTGTKLGTRTIRDTLYITRTGGEYRVVNAKWRMNDYDTNGWQDMEHGDGGPFPTFAGSYDKSSRRLSSPGGVPSLMFSEDGKLSVGGKSEVPYYKLTR